ncbi:YdcF family protein [Pseudodesulfovibrio sp.]|nr:YdcF family protein [Pseudodesulfovibrio sp.]
MATILGKRLLKLGIGLSLAANIGLFLILFTPLTAWMHQALATGDEPRRAPAVVVLSSVFPYQTEQGMLGLSTATRLRKGLELYRQGLADKIIVFGGTSIKSANKTLAQAMKERLLLNGVPEQDIIVHDDIPGGWQYYDNLLQLMEKYKDTYDFSEIMFVTSSEQSFRIRKCLETQMEHPIIVLSEPYEMAADWAQRFQLFRRAANEMFVAIPLFYMAGRF